MKTIHAGIGVLLGSLLVLTLGAGSAPTTREQPDLVVGTFDSRAIAVAYVQSDAYQEYLSALKAHITGAIEQARTAGDKQLIASLEGVGPAMQQRLHEQGFGTAPVDDIIAKIEDALPGIAARAGVDVIVSKWTLSYSSPGARFVDVTGLLAAEFDPSERTLIMIQSTMEAAPVPIDELDHDH